MMRFRDRFDRSRRKPSTRNQRIGFAYFWLIVLCYAFFISTDANWNTESHLYPAFSIVDRHTLTIDAYQQRLGDKSYWKGHYYGDKAPGVTILATPVYALLRIALPGQKGQPYEVYPHMRYAIPRSTVYLRYAITYLLVILPSALFAVLLWLFFCRFLSSGLALMLSATYALGTVAWTYSTWIFSHQIVAILLFGAFILIFSQVRRAAGGRGAYTAAAVAGGMCGYAAITEYPAALTVAVLGLYLLAVSRRKLQTAVAFAVGASPAVSLGMAYNIAAFGRPFATGYMYVKSSLYHAHISSGFLGLSNPLAYGVQPPSLTSLWQITFGAYRGIFLVCPVLLLFVAGLAFMWRRREFRAELWVCLAVFLLSFLLDASRDVMQTGWSGGAGVASRHLTPAVPFMMLPIAFGFANHVFRAAWAVLAVMSTSIMFAIVSSVGLFSYTDQNPLLHQVLPRFFGGHMEVNWGYMTGSTGFGSLAPFGILAALLVLRLVWLFRRPATTTAQVPMAELEAV